MPTPDYNSRIYEDLPLGGQLGHLEYVLTEELLQKFRDVVEFPEACFPSIAVKEYIEVLVRKYGYLPVISAKHSERYYSHPRPNKRIQVSGWVRDKYQRRGRKWLVVDTFAVDEDGREILRSEHTFLVGGLTGGSLAT
jgi:hypothetical protein